MDDCVSSLTSEPGLRVTLTTPKLIAAACSPPLRLPLPPSRVLVRPEVTVAIRATDLSLLIFRRAVSATVAFADRRSLIAVEVAFWLLSVRHRRW